MQSISEPVCPLSFRSKFQIFAAQTGKRPRSFQARIESLEARTLLTSVAGDLNGDGIADLAIGVPGQTVGGFADAGEVQILYGTPRTSYVQSDGTVNPGLNGLTTKSKQLITEASLGITPQAGDGFGTARGCGRF